MKVKRLRFTFLVLLIWSVLASCGSVPESPPTEPAPEPSVTTTPPVETVDPNSARPDQVSLNNLAAASQRAEEARKMIEDFKGV